MDYEGSSETTEYDVARDKLESAYDTWNRGDDVGDAVAVALIGIGHALLAVADKLGPPARGMAPAADLAEPSRLEMPNGPTRPPVRRVPAGGAVWAVWSFVSRLAGTHTGGERGPTAPR